MADLTVTAHVAADAIFGASRLVREEPSGAHEQAIA
jgi:hypothetical protein